MLFLKAMTEEALVFHCLGDFCLQIEMFLWGHISVESVEVLIFLSEQLRSVHGNLTLECCVEAQWKIPASSVHSSPNHADMKPDLSTRRSDNDSQNDVDNNNKRDGRVAHTGLFTFSHAA